MKYLPLGFSIAAFLAAGAIAMTTSAQAGLQARDPAPAAAPEVCQSTSSQSCGPDRPAALR